VSRHGGACRAGCISSLSECRAPCLLMLLADEQRFEGKELEGVKGSSVDTSARINHAEHVLAACTS
jgi:hypothetical protein